MLEKKYLHNNGKFVKKFVARGINPTETTSICSKIRDITPKYGELIFTKKTSDTSNLFVIIFEDPMMMLAWNSQLPPAIIEDVVAVKVLILTSSSAELVNKTYKSLIEKLPMYSGYILDEDKLSEEEYRLLLFFTNIREMNRFTSEQNILE